MKASSATRAALGPQDIWNQGRELSPRVETLRKEFWSFYTRDWTNEVRAFTTGTQWDAVYSVWNWTNVPELKHFFAGSASYLLAAARHVSVPRGFWSEPLSVRASLFFAEVVRHHLPVQINDGELVVGSHFCTALSRCLTRGEARARGRAEAAFLRRWRQLDDTGIGNCGAIPGHLVPDYPKALRIGWAGIAEEARQVARSWTASRAKRAQARAMVLCAEAMRDFAERYAKEADRLAAAEIDPARRAELETIALACRKVPWRPAETFPEALQSLWMTHMLVLIAESYPGPGVSPGRIDQYLLPYYESDLCAGRLTREQAKEWLACWWIKHNYAYDYQGWAGTNQGINSSFGQLVTLSGLDKHGHDATNDLTFLALEVLEELNLLEPKPNVRLHEKSPDELLLRLTDMIASSQGSPFLLNFDESSIRGLQWQGLPPSELWNYTPVGCLENALPGCDRSGTVDVNLNMAKAIELALNDGRDVASGTRLGPSTGDPRRMLRFDDVLKAYKTQLRALLETIIGVNNMADAGRARWEPVPYLSALVGGCLESGRDANAGGARFNFITVEGIGLATATDSLAAIKKLVFEERRLDMDTLLRALRVSFQDYENVRQMLINKAPKYGNDDSFADEIAQIISRFWSHEAFKHRSPTGKRYRAGYLSWNYWVSYAPSTAATPDGRRRGQYLSNAVCAVNGSDRKGPTAAIKSVGKLGLESVPNGASHTISLDPSLLRAREGRLKLAALLRAYARVGGTALQLNVVSPETLRKAQRDPDAYRNLMVRITGYNAYFVGLGKEIQDELIARCAHQL